ncbi:hypothetical protein [Bradyrhizobium yuanmingense]|uniref:hypothetical protein n=1 Tax=Bradyrhizobium yuanmingense TaxID=108015 RepID=UPI0005644EE1|nr:hypothetical protein [Bradyrhizobium yuanmingense]
MTSRSKEQIRDYMRDYMRDRRTKQRIAVRKRNTPADRAYKRAEYKSEAPGIHTKGDFVRRDLALYDPRRDDPLHHADLTALVMGDPPIGRRAIDQHKAKPGAAA